LVRAVSACLFVVERCSFKTHMLNNWWEPVDLTSDSLSKKEKHNVIS
jgi:hypothetical protein